MLTKYWVIYYNIIRSFLHLLEIAEKSFLLAELGVKPCNLCFEIGFNVVSGQRYFDCLVRRVIRSNNELAKRKPRTLNYLRGVCGGVLVAVLIFNLRSSVVLFPKLR